MSFHVTRVQHGVYNKLANVTVLKLDSISEQSYIRVKTKRQTYLRITTCIDNTKNEHKVVFNFS